MSAWFDRLLKGMAPELGRLHLAHDPDKLLLDEFALSALAERGFTVLTFEDEVLFRLEYETRFRGRWDDGLPSETPAVLMHYAGEELDDLPWDLTQAAVIHRLSLAEIFTGLELSVVRSMPVDTLGRLHDRYQALSPGALGANATADFLLLNVYRIAEVLLESDADFLRILLDLHFRRVELPSVLASRLAKQLGNRPALIDWPLQLLLEDRSSFLVFIEERWKIAIDRALSDNSTAIHESRPAEYLLRIAGPEILPFDHDQVRVLLDNMFTEGHLPRYRLTGDIPDVFGWMAIGVKIDDARVTAKQFLCLLYRLKEIVPAADARHGEWVKFAWSMADLIQQWHGLPLETQEGIADEMSGLLAEVDSSFAAWRQVRYGPLASLPSVSAPVMGHHVAPFLNRHVEKGAKVALIVMDGMAMDQWQAIEACRPAIRRQFEIEKDGLFAWAPTLTGIARHALFAGAIPRQLKGFGSTQGEPSAWKSFWAGHGLGQSAVAYIKGIQRAEQIAAVEELASGSQVRAMGIVVDAIDTMMHGMTLGTRGLHSQVATWAEAGLLEKLFAKLLGLGFEVFVTADHGNIEARGSGSVSQGALAEVKGERVRIYGDRTLYEKTTQELGGRAEAGLAIGLPENTYPLYAAKRSAFVAEGTIVVGHGGCSVEEVIVPFLRIRSFADKRIERGRA